jgi:hypothetical protein
MTNDLEDKQLSVHYLGQLLTRLKVARMARITKFRAAFPQCIIILHCSKYVFT